MSRVINFSLFLLSIILSFIIDGFFSILTSQVLPFPFVITSHVLLIFLLFSVELYNGKWLYVIFFIVGLIYDSLTFLSLPVSSLIFPLLVFILIRHSGLLVHFATRFLLIVVFLFIFDFFAYVMGWLYGFTKLSLESFITYNVMPTLVFNLVIFLLVSSFIIIFTKRVRMF